jgi:hypothetical protein
MENQLPELPAAIRDFVPPVRALVLAVMAGIMLGTTVPVSFLQQAAGPLSQLSSSVMLGH